MDESIERFVGLDLHKAYCMIGAVNAQQQVVLTPRKVKLSTLVDWAVKHLSRRDAVVIEASTNTWTVYDQLQPLVGRVVVAHPYHIKLIAASFVKTDKRDTLALARLLAANLVPQVWVPPQSVRELRALVAHRLRLVAQRTAAKNRLQDLVHRHQLVPPAGDVFMQKNRGWWLALKLSGPECLRLQHNLETIDRLTVQIQQTEHELAVLSASEQWRTPVARLVQLPGIGMVSAMTILSAIGDIQRFASAKKLVGYAGLGSGVHASGQTHRNAGITKQGRTELRRTLIEAAWTAVNYSAIWKARFARLVPRLGKMKAITAIARKLLVVIWHVLTHQQPDRNADAKAVSRSLLTWATHHRLAAQLHMSRADFVAQGMQQLGLQVQDVDPAAITVLPSG